MRGWRVKTPNNRLLLRLRVAPTRNLRGPKQFSAARDYAGLAAFEARPVRMLGNGAPTSCSRGYALPRAHSELIVPGSFAAKPKQCGRACDPSHIARAIGCVGGGEHSMS